VKFRFLAAPRHEKLLTPSHHARIVRSVDTASTTKGGFDANALRQGALRLTMGGSRIGSTPNRLYRL